MSPNTGLALHDRSCRTFVAHTLCLTNEQEFFRQKIPHSDAYSFHVNRESLQDKVADVLTHPVRYVDIGIKVAAAFRKVMNPTRG